MTTIAYKDGIVAYDGRCLSNYDIISDVQDKCFSSKGVDFFVSGTIGDVDEFMDAYHNGLYYNKDLDIDINCIIHDEGYLYHGYSHDGKIYKTKIDPGLLFAVGSGRDYAMAFMSAGKSAEEAVSSVMTLDCGTGGKIRVKHITDQGEKR